MSRPVRIGAIAVGIAVVLFIALQWFPIGLISPDFVRANPPVQNTIQWDSPETEALVRAACYDCHSNETVYPWYSQIAPVSWLVNKDINEGRSELNFSERTADQIDPEELVEEIREGGMPLPIYLPMHPEARLTAEQQDALIRGLMATLHGTEAGEGERGEDNDEDGV